jgi:two-component system chemotaxis response regulator CheY
MKALIADDDAFCRRMLQKMLSPYALCETAAEGPKAVQAFTSALEKGEPFDLVCLDILMPELDGHEVLEKIRASERAAGVAPEKASVVFMTTGASTLDNVQTFKDKCHAFLVKPIEKQRLLEALTAAGLVSKEQLR